MLKADLACALDPVCLAGRAGLIPDDWQAKVLRSMAKQLLLLCSRQSGKSVTVSLLAVYEAIYRGPALILCLSPSQRQSAELLRKIIEILGRLSISSGQQSALSVSLPNGSRIVALPGRDDAAIRGFSSVSLLLIDEAARVSDSLYQAVRPMLAVSSGRLLLLSTPFGRRGFLFHEWEEGEGWERVRITADECPRIPADWLKRERAAIGEWWASQEYDCLFVDSASQAFGFEHVMGAVSGDVAPLWREVV